MPSGLIDEEDGVGSWCDRLGNFGQMQVHGFGVAGGQDQSRCRSKTSESRGHGQRSQNDLYGDGRRIERIYSLAVSGLPRTCVSVHSKFAIETPKVQLVAVFAGIWIATTEGASNVVYLHL